ncbi:MAG: tetrathionate reductase family octaheme c-type cytochrome [Actinobacteria bacterium]|nr:tetrathionate reductase family octaheme c-type cytochrome [Actinomycetota bacterium]
MSSLPPPDQSPSRHHPWLWVGALAATLAIVAIPIILFVPERAAEADDPWAHVPDRVPETSHAALLTGPFETGQEVTAACLECHEDAAEQMKHTVHFTWQAEPVEVEGRDEPVALGKANAINNFCIGIQGNWPACTSCHAGYGWEDDTYDFTEDTNVDCLVCHDTSGQYVKANAGVPAEGVDLVAAAQSVGGPSRTNCGGCHFAGGGGDAVKHGDLDTSLSYPSANVDVHMGEYDFICTDCHKTEDHQISGRAASVSLDDVNGIDCTDCHSEDLHEDDRINSHVSSVACRTCHIPTEALREPTKVHWDWSAAGQDLPEDVHEYLKIKGSFIYEDDLVPHYEWSNGTVSRYLLGDPIEEDGSTALNAPNGSIDDPDSKIFPFKIHTAIQIYDPVYGYLIQPKTFGEGGYWTDFDWDEAARLGMEIAGLAYSGEYDFTETTMHWPTAHMVQPAENALQCNDCHGEGGRLDWASLGYEGDPMIYGGREAGQG